MKVFVYTLFPAWFDGPLGDSIIQRAREEGRLSIEVLNFRRWATGKHQSVDDAPYGGGAGMVLRADVLARAMDETLGAPGSPDRPYTILMSPRGRTFDQRAAIQLAQKPAIAFVCGHYEGVDQRFIDTRIDEEISIGNFVLTGGELPAMAMIDAIARMIPGVLGNEASAQNDSFMNGLLEGPQYTRPEVFEGEAVPPVLLSGNHGAIAKWREEEALKATRAARAWIDGVPLYLAQLLHPEQVRRLARRGKPLLVWEWTPDTRPPEPDDLSPDIDEIMELAETEMQGRLKGKIRVLFCSTLVKKVKNWRHKLPTMKYEESEILPGFRFAEVKEAATGDLTADRASLRRDLEDAVARFDKEQVPPESTAPLAEQFVRNLLREMKKIDGASGDEGPRQGH